MSALPVSTDPIAVSAERDRVGSVWPAIWAPTLLIAATIVVYAPTVNYPFVFDGLALVTNNEAIRQLWPPDWFYASGRPLALATFAVNYAISGREPWSYHLVNIAIHLSGGLVLYDLLRRLLSSSRWGGRYRTAASGLAFSIAILWLVHPLQTQTVTYLYQRFEALMGLFCLLAVYALLRATEGSRSRTWYVVSLISVVGACASKESAVVLPLLLLWFDRVFLCDSWKELLQRRWLYHLLTVGGLLVVGCMVWLNRSWYAGGGVLVFDSITPWEYARSQPKVIIHYLQTVFWPTGLSIDYGWPVADSAVDILPYMLVVIGLLAATLYCAFRYPAIGFLGAWFLIFLAPTSSFLPIRDLAFDHRMYLPLAAVAALVVLGAYVFLCWALESTRGPKEQPEGAGATTILASLLLIVTALALIGASLQRNILHKRPSLLWADAATKNPANSRAHVSLFESLVAEGRAQEAIAAAKTARELLPSDGSVAYIAGAAHRMAGDEIKALNELDQAVVGKYAVHALGHRSLVYRSLGNLPRAIDDLTAAINKNPSYYEGYHNRGLLHMECGHHGEAVHDFKVAATLSENPSRDYLELGKAYWKAGQLPPAVECLAKAGEADALAAEAGFYLGQVLLDAGRVSEAAKAFSRVLQRQPGNLQAIVARSIALARLGNHQAALADLDLAQRLDPDMVSLHNNRAVVLLQAGQADAAAIALQRFIQSGGRPHPAFVAELTQALNRNGNSPGPQVVPGTGGQTQDGEGAR